MRIFTAMKSHFTGLFDYDKYANTIIVNLLISNNAGDRAIEVMAHMLNTYQTWLGRCKGLPPSGIPIWPEADMATFVAQIDKNHADWVAYIDTLQSEDYDRIITYQTSTGATFSNKLVDIIVHTINHGTHHRGQIGTLLRADGLQELPMLDYILYIREKNDKQ